MSDVAFLGTRDIIEGFNALGTAVFPVNDSQVLKEALKDVLKANYKILFITETWAEEASGELEGRAKKGIFPIVVVIPDTGEGKGIAEARLRKIAKMAIGKDTLFDYGR